MKIKQHIPNIFTLVNALCGGLALVFIMQGRIEMACLLVMIAAVFDFFDGFVARAMGVTSELGKQLDSLSDVISFGVVPAFFAYYLFWKFNGFTGNQYPHWWGYITIIIVPFSAYRLGKFNLDTRQSTGFLGLPTPANGLFWTGLALILAKFEGFYGPELAGASQNTFLATHTSMAVSHSIISLFINYPYLILALSVIFSILLVTEIPLFAMKFKSYGWKGNEIKFIFLALSLLLLIVMPFVALPIIIILYILLSIINNFITPTT